MIKALLFFGMVMIGFVSAQPTVPLIAGSQLEMGMGSLPQARTGAGIVRVTPFLGAWLNGIGYAKIGGSMWSSSLSDSNGVNHGWEERDFTVQLGVTLGGPQKPYLIGSFTRCNELTDLGDATWREWGAGLGTFFTLGGYSAISLEVEHRWISSHYDPLRDLTINGTRIQMNLGFVVYFL
jgi:hypothetical protein